MAAKANISSGERSRAIVAILFEKSVWKSNFLAL